MRTTVSQQKFLDSEEAAQIRSALEKMVFDPLFNTKAQYTAGTNNSWTFVEKHMQYLSEHPKLNPQHYLSNLRLMTRVKM
jgi:hypothetical protein